GWSACGAPAARMISAPPSPGPLTVAVSSDFEHPGDFGVHSAVEPVKPLLERQRRGLRANEATARDRLVRDPGPFQREVVAVRLGADDEGLLAVLERPHLPALPVLERDREAGADGSVELRCGPCGRHRPVGNTDGHQRRRRYQSNYAKTHVTAPSLSRGSF